MKKIILTLLFIIAVSQVFAQTVKFGITGGINESSLDNNDVTGNDYSRLTGFRAGVFSEINFGALSVEPGLLYTTKGVKDKYTLLTTMPGSNLSSAEGKAQSTYSYLQLPVNVVYNIPVSYGKFFIGGGPYLAYGLSAKAKTKTTFSNNDGTSQVTEQDYPLTFGSKNGDLNRFEFGVGALGGFVFKNNILVSLAYEHGVTNVVYKNSPSVQNDVLSLSLGYIFK